MNSELTFLWNTSGFSSMEGCVSCVSMFGRRQAFELKSIAFQEKLYYTHLHADKEMCDC